MSLPNAGESTLMYVLQNELGLKYQYKKGKKFLKQISTKRWRRPREVAGPSSSKEASLPEQERQSSAANGSRGKGKLRPLGGDVPSPSNSSVIEKGIQRSESHLGSINRLSENKIANISAMKEEIEPNAKPDAEGMPNLPSPGLVVSPEPGMQSSKELRPPPSPILHPHSCSHITVNLQNTYIAAIVTERSSRQRGLALWDAETTRIVYTYQNRKGNWIPPLFLTPVDMSSPTMTESPNCEFSPLTLFAPNLSSSVPLHFALKTLTYLQWQLVRIGVQSGLGLLPLGHVGSSLSLIHKQP